MSSSGIRAAGRAGAACLTLALAACGGGLAERAAGDAPTFVSLNPCLDAILVEVAEPAQVLALSHYSRDPAATSMEVAKAARFGVTGGTAEEVIALDPDVVLASSFIDPATRSALERAGMRVETFGSPSTGVESIAQVRALARLSGHPERAGPLVRAIAAPRDASFPDGMTALLWQPGEIIAGESSLVAEHLRWAGLSNYAETHGLGQADHVSLEQILADPPDLLLVAGDAPGQLHPLLAGLQSMHVAAFDPGLFYCAGPSIPAARARLLDIRQSIAEART